MYTSKVRGLLFATSLMLVTNSTTLFAQANQNQDDNSPKAQVFVPLVKNGQDTDVLSESPADNLSATKHTSAIQFTETEMQDASTFWTRSTRQSAKAIEPLPFDPAEFDARARSLPEESGPKGFALGGKPNPTALVQARREFAEEWKVAEAGAEVVPEEVVNASGVSEAQGTDNVYTTYLGNFYSEMWQGLPYGATGKLYSSVGSCSASVISPNNIIVTAAHCVYNTTANQWYTNIVFVPAERNGAAPYGNFPSQQARVLNAWIALPSNQVSRYDVAVVQLANNQFGRPVTFYTGWLARSWNFGYVQSITEIGYPSNLPSGSSYTYIGHAESYSGGTDLLNYGSNMGFGASGSPIIRIFAPFQTGAVDYVNGVQSGSAPNGNSPTRSIAPRFSSTNIVPLCTDQGC